MTLLITKFAAIAIVATIAGSGTAFASGDCPAGYLAVDSNGWANKIEMSTRGNDEYVAIDQYGHRQVLKGKLVGDCIALVAGQYGKFNWAEFTIVGDRNAVGIVQHGNSRVKVKINGTDSTVGGNLKDGTDVDINIVGQANVSINQS